MTTATQKDDLAFGKKNEEESVDMLEQYLDTTLKHRGSYSVLDFENPTKTVFVELKSRRIPSTAYTTAIVGLNKIHAMNNIEDMEYYIAFKYSDGLFTIKYEKELFDTYEVRYEYCRGPRIDCINKPQDVVMVPIKDLTKIEYEEVEEY